MTTSGTYTYEPSLNDILGQSYDALQIGQDGETLTGDFYNRARPILNSMLKAWEGQGIHLWTMKEGTLFLRVGQAVYPFGDSSTHLANDYYETVTTAEVASGVSVLPVEDTAGFANGNPIGVIGDDNDLQWFTIVSFVADTSVTLSSPVLSDIVENSVIYTYTLNSFIPVVRILDVRRKQTDDYEVPINFVSREEYMSLPNKDQPGNAIQAYYSRQIPYGTMYVWNAPYSAVPVLRFTYERKIQIMEEAEDTFDVPENWYEAIVYNLALRLIPVFGCAPGRKVDLQLLAQNALDSALGFDTDIYPITVNLQRY